MHKEINRKVRLRTNDMRLNEQNSVQAAVVLGVVGNLGPTTPDDLSTRGDQTKFRDVDLDDSTLGQDTELSVHGVLGVLLDGDDGELDGDTEFGVGDVCLLVTKTHGTNESGNV